MSGRAFCTHSKKIIITFPKNQKVLCMLLDNTYSCYDEGVLTVDCHTLAQRIKLGHSLSPKTESKTYVLQSHP